MKTIKNYNDFINESIEEPQLNESLEGDELYAHILQNYVGKVEDELNMDDFSDEFEYYDNVIYQSVGNYMSEEDEDADEDELNDGLKNYWQPI